MWAIRSATGHKGAVEASPKSIDFGKYKMRKLPKYLGSAITVLFLLNLIIPANAGIFSSGNDEVAMEVSELDQSNMPGTMDFSPDGKSLAVDAWDRGTDIWDIAQKRIIKHLQEGGKLAWFDPQIRYSPNGRQLAICSGFDLYVYNTSSWERTYPAVNEDKTKVSGGRCESIAFTPDGKELVVVGVPGVDIFHPGNNIMFYDTSSWQATRGVRTMPLVKSDAPPNVDRQIVTKYWTKLETPDVLLTDPSNKYSDFYAQALSISKDGKYIGLVGTSFQSGLAPDHAEVVIIDISKLSLVHVIREQAESFDWSPDNIHVAYGPTDNNIVVKITDTTSGAIVASETGDPNHVIVRYTPDGKYLIEKVGRKVEIWDGQHKKQLQVINAEPFCMAVSKDGKYFALGGAPNSILDVTPMLSLITHPNGPSGKVLIYKVQ